MCERRRISEKIHYVCTIEVQRLPHDKGSRKEISLQSTFKIRSDYTYIKNKHKYNVLYNKIKACINEECFNGSILPQKRVEAWIFVKKSTVAFPGFIFGILAPILFK